MSDKQKVLIHRTVTKWWHIRVCKSLITTLPFLKSWGNSERRDPRHIYTLDGFCSFESQRRCHQWTELTIQLNETEDAVSKFINTFVCRSLTPGPSSMDKIFLIAYNFSHHGRYIGASEQLVYLSCAVGQAFLDLLNDPANRLLHVVFFLCLVRFYHTFSYWKLHDFDRATTTLANMVAAGINKYLSISFDINAGKIDISEGVKLLALYDSFQASHFSQLERLLGSHAAKSLVLNIIASYKYSTLLLSTMSRRGINRLDNDLLSLVVENELQRKASDALVPLDSLDSLKNALSGYRSTMRQISFQALIDTSYRISYPWSRAAHFDTAAYLTPERRLMGLVKRQIISARDFYSKKPNKYIPGFIPNIIKYLYDTLSSLLALSSKRKNRTRNAVTIDLPFIDKQCSQGVFDGARYFGHYFCILEHELDLSRSERAEKLRTSKVAIYSALDRLEFPFEGLLSLIELLEFVRTDYINSDIRSRQSVDQNLVRHVEQACFLEDLLTQKVQLLVLNRWASEVSASKTVGSRRDLELELTKRFARFMTSFYLTNKGQVQLDDLPEICLLTRQLIVEYKLQLKDIAVSSAICHYLLHILGFPGIKLIDVGQLKKVVFYVVRNDTNSIKFVSHYIQRILNTIINYLLSPGQTKTARTNGEQLCKLFASSGLLYPEYALKEIEEGGRKDGEFDIYWSVDPQHYGVVDIKQAESLNRLLVLKNPRKWLLEKVTRIVKSPNDECLSKASFDWIEDKLVNQVLSVVRTEEKGDDDEDVEMKDTNDSGPLGSKSPSVKRHPHLYEEEAEYSISKITSLWENVLITYEPILEAFWKFWKVDYVDGCEEVYNCLCGGHDDHASKETLTDKVR